MQYENIEYEKRSAIAYVTLNRPDKLNALSPDLQLEVRHALEDAGWEDDDIRVIVLKAAALSTITRISSSSQPASSRAWRTSSCRSGDKAFNLSGRFRVT